MNRNSWVFYRSAIWPQISYCQIRNFWSSQALLFLAANLDYPAGFTWRYSWHAILKKRTLHGGNNTELAAYNVGLEGRKRRVDHQGGECILKVQLTETHYGKADVCAEKRWDMMATPLWRPVPHCGSLMLCEISYFRMRTDMLAWAFLHTFGTLSRRRSAASFIFSATRRPEWRWFMLPTERLATTTSAMNLRIMAHDVGHKTSWSQDAWVRPCTSAAFPCLKCAFPCTICNALTGFLQGLCTKGRKVTHVTWFRSCLVRARFRVFCASRPPRTKSGWHYDLLTEPVQSKEAWWALSIPLGIGPRGRALWEVPYTWQELLPLPQKHRWSGAG